MADVTFESSAILSLASLYVKSLSRGAKVSLLLPCVVVSGFGTCVDVLCETVKEPTGEKRVDEKRKGESSF